MPGPGRGPGDEAHPEGRRSRSRGRRNRSRSRRSRSRGRKDGGGKGKGGGKEKVGIAIHSHYQSRAKRWKARTKDEYDNDGFLLRGNHDHEKARRVRCAYGNFCGVHKICSGLWCGLVERVQHDGILCSVYLCAILEVPFTRSPPVRSCSVQMEGAALLSPLHWNAACARSKHTRSTAVQW